MNNNVTRTQNTPPVIQDLIEFLEAFKIPFSLDDDPHFGMRNISIATELPDGTDCVFYWNSNEPDSVLPQIQNEF